MLWCSLGFASGSPRITGLLAWGVAGMTRRTSFEITFRRPAFPRSLGRAVAPGTCHVEIMEEPTEGLPLPAHRRLATLIGSRCQAAAQAPARISWPPRRSSLRRPGSEREPAVRRMARPVPRRPGTADDRARDGPLPLCRDTLVPGRFRPGRGGEPVLAGGSRHLCPRPRWLRAALPGLHVEPGTSPVLGAAEPRAAPAARAGCRLAGDGQRASCRTAPAESAAGKSPVR